MSSQAGFLKTRRLSAAAALLLLMLAGCVISPRRDGTGTTTNPPPPGGSNPGKLYVTNESGNAILRFDNALSATGDQTPAVTMSNSSQIAAPQYLAIDTASDRLYVAVNAAVLVYDNASTRATGNVVASRIIGGLSTPTDLALDRIHDQLYVTDGFSILVFANASTANGSPTPLRTISPLSGGSGFNVAAIFLDTGTDKLYVADSLNSAVNIYDAASGLNGSVNAPRTLAGANTGLSNPQGLQVDALGRLIVANNTGSITIYANAISVSGTTAPSATITSPAANMVGPSQIFLSTGNELYVADGTAGGIPIFSGVNSANGNIIPARDITGAHTTLSRANAGSASTARGVALDPTR